MELSQYILKVAISLLVVIVAIVFLLPLILRRSMGLKGFGGKGSFEIKKVSPITKNTYIVELEVKGKTIILCVGEKGADLIYSEHDNKASPDSSGGSADISRSGGSDTAG